MKYFSPVNPELFRAIQKLDVQLISRFPESDIKVILPCLVRVCLISPADIVPKCTDLRQLILCILSGIGHVNSIVALLSIDFHNLETDIRKEQLLRQKGSHSTATGAEIGTIILQQKPILRGISYEFERSDSTRRIRLVINELLQIQSEKQVNELDFFFKDSDLFDNEIYLNEISDVICITLAELPSLFTIIDVVELLLHVRNGATLITWVVANFPDTFLEVCTSLIENSDKDNDDSFGNQVRFKTLKELCTMNPSENLTVRMKAIEINRMAPLAIYLTLNQSHSNDLVSFISGLLLGADQSNRNWFAQFIRTRQKKKLSAAGSAMAIAEAESPSMIVLQLLRTKLMDKLVEIKKSAVNNKLVSDVQLVKASALLKVYCALRGIGGIKFQDDEIGHLINLITLHTAATSAGVRFISLGLCTLIACPSIISQSSDNEKRCIEWIQSLIREETYFTVANKSTDSFGEMLLLMAIHFHSNQVNAICDLVCGTLGMRVAIRSNSLSKIRMIFVQDLFTEQVVAAHAVKVPVTTHLNGLMTGFLPIHCIYQLIKSRVFIKYRINIKTWIYRQILSTTSPLHPIWSLLIDAYVNSIVNQQQQQQVSLSDIQAIIISEQEILGSFLDENGVYYDSEDCLTAQMLLIYFVLLYEDNCLTNNSLKTIYTAEFVNKLPIKYLLQKIHTHTHMISFSVLFGALLRLLATNHPHLYLVEDLMDIHQDNSDKVVFNNGSIEKLTPNTVADALNSVCVHPQFSYKVLTMLCNQYKPMELWKEFMNVIVSEIGTMLDLVHVPRHIQELYAKIWFKLNSVLPGTLWKLTIEALLKLGNKNHWNKHQWYLDSSSITDPLLILSCDIRAFRCAPILNIILRVLKSNLACSRSELIRHIKTTSLIMLDKINGGISGMLSSGHQMVGDQERDELRLALIAAQESAAVQILLDRCMVSEHDDKFPGFEWALRECRGLVCSFLHQMFIADTSLAKLVHFQGYPKQLLEITVTSIPSMHICLDFIPELLSLPDWEKQIFAIHLVAHLSVQYSLPKSLSMAKLALNTLHTLIEVVPSNQYVISALPILDDLPLICIAFPILNTDVIELLLRMGRICHSLSATAAVQKSFAFKEKLLLSVVQKQIETVYESIIQKTVLKN